MTMPSPHPTTAVIMAFGCSGRGNPTDQAFPISCTEFNKKVKALAGADFSSHSFRRGGATHALSSGVPVAVIQTMGDWKSNVYLSYLDQLLLSVISHYTDGCTLPAFLHLSSLF